MDKVSGLPEILEASLEELIALVGDSDPFSSIELFYGKCMIHYHRSETAALDELIQAGENAFSALPEWPSVRFLLKLRAATRAKAINQSLLAEGEGMYEASGRWKGEVAILIGHGLIQLDRHGEAKAWFVRAAKEFEKIGCRKKSLRASLNGIVTETHLNPKANFIPKYFDLYKKSKKLGGDVSVACLCLLNISREYQLIGSHAAALKYASMALEAGESSFGSQQYYLILAHRAHVLCELGRYAEARIDYELARATAHKEVQASLALVCELLLVHFPEIATTAGEAKHLLPSWRENRSAKPEARLSDLENQLVDYLGTGPKARGDILEHLYGERLDLEVKLNRFKSMLGHLRRKHPHLVVYENGLYRLAENFVSPKKGDPNAA